MRRRPGILIVFTNLDRDTLLSLQRDHRCNFVHHRDRPDHRLGGVAAHVLHIERECVNARFDGIDGSRGLDRLGDVTVHAVLRRRSGILVGFPDADRDTLRPVQRDHRRNPVHHRDRPGHRRGGVAALVLHIKRDRVNARCACDDHSGDSDQTADVPVRVVVRRRPGVLVSLPDLDREALLPFQRDHRRCVVRHAERHLG